MADHPRPKGLRWRSKPSFVISTVALGLFTDFFLYGVVVPVLPFMLKDRLSTPDDKIQSYASILLATYAGAAVLFAIPAGWVADKIGPRQPSYLAGLVLLFVSTIFLAFGQSLFALVLARLLQGMSAAVVSTTGLTMVQDTVGPGRIGETIGTIFSIISVGELIAPVLGGILYEKAGIFGVFSASTGLLAIDLLMRLLVIDTRMVEKYKYKRLCAGEDSSEARPTRSEPAEPEAGENDPLLPKVDNESYKIPGEPGKLYQVAPVMYCLRQPRLLVALWLTFAQALVAGIFDATVPLEAESLFDFSSLKIGLLYMAFAIPYLAFGRAAGAAADRYGTRAVGTGGFGFLVPCLALLALPSQKILMGSGNVVLFCSILALNGIGLTIVGVPGFVEVSNIADKFDAANPRFFGENGPYGQLYGFNTISFFSGLAVGPLLGGVLKDNYGYSVMTVVVAAISGATALLSFCAL